MKSQELDIDKVRSIKAVENIITKHEIKMQKYKMNYLDKKNQ